MAQPIRKRATYADIVALPTGVTGEILGGELYTHPRPRYRHGRGSQNLGALLCGAYNRDTHGPNDPGGWVILTEPELHLGDDVIVPDLAGWRVERATWDEDAAFLEITPDWCCEILSPSTETKDRSIKMPIYANNLVTWAWLIDPDDKYLEVFKLEAGVLRQFGQTYRGRVSVTAPPFEELTLDLWRIWG